MGYEDVIDRKLDVHIGILAFISVLLIVSFGFGLSAANNIANKTTLNMKISRNMSRLAVGHPDLIKIFDDITNATSEEGIYITVQESVLFYTAVERIDKGTK